MKCVKRREKCEWLCLVIFICLWLASLGQKSNKMSINSSMKHIKMQNGFRESLKIVNLKNTRRPHQILALCRLSLALSLELDYPCLLLPSICSKIAARVQYNIVCPAYHRPERERICVWKIYKQFTKSINERFLHYQIEPEITGLTQEVPTGSGFIFHGDREREHSQVAKT